MCTIWIELGGFPDFQHTPNYSGEQFSALEGKHIWHIQGKKKKKKWRKGNVTEMIVFVSYYPECF